MKQAMASDERDVPGSGRTAAEEATGFSEDQLRAITSVVRSLLNEEFSAGRQHPREESRGDDGRGSSGPGSRQRPHTNPTSTPRHDSQGTARLDLGAVGSTLQRLLQAGLAPSTQRAYRSGKKKYLAYCQSVGTAPLPTSEEKLMNFVAAMVNQGLKQQTMKGYLSAVRHLQIECGGRDPRVEKMPLLELALRGQKGNRQACPQGPGYQ